MFFKIARPSQKSHAKAASISSAAVVLWGNAMAYFDNFLYIHMFVIISPLFFPDSDGGALLSLSLSAGFILNYLARPFGALLFGCIGDKVGRRTALYASLAFMLLATGVMGVLPTYAQAGVYASVALLISRFLQGLSCSGESAGALIYVVETVPSEKRYFYSALYNATITGGGVAAALVVTLSLGLLSGDNAWRYPFQIVGVLGGISLVIRYKKIAETKEFRANRQKSETFKIGSLICDIRNVKGIARVASFAAFDAATFWITYIFLTDILKKHTGLSDIHIVVHNGCVMCFEIIIGFVAARFLTKSTARLFSLYAVGVMTLAIWPLLWMVKNFHYAYGAILAVQLFTITCGNSFCISTDPARARMFPVIGRFVSMAFGMSMGKIMGYVIGAYALIAVHHLGVMGGAFYLLAFSIPALISLFTMRDEEAVQQSQSRALSAA